MRGRAQRGRGTTRTAWGPGIRGRREQGAKPRRRWGPRTDCRVCHEDAPGSLDAGGRLWSSRSEHLDWNGFKKIGREASTKK